MNTYPVAVKCALARHFQKFSVGLRKPAAAYGRTDVDGKNGYYTTEVGSQVDGQTIEIDAMMTPSMLRRQGV